MSSIRRLLVASALAAVPFAGAVRLAHSAEPVCNKWDLEVSCETNPNRVIVTDPFKGTVTVKNTGDKALANVTISLRGDLGARCVDGNQTEVKTLVEKLEPGETKQLSATFASDTVGVARVIGGARDALGWAAANCACTVDIIGLPAVQSDMADVDMTGNDKKGVFVVGDQFQYVLNVVNDGGTTVTPDLHVEFTLPKELEFVSGKAGDGQTVTGSGQAAQTSPFVLAPDKGLKFEIVVKVIGAPATNLVQTKASILTDKGVEVAQETESTTLKLAPAIPAPANGGGAGGG
jgi:uncharacterized repeat protein (TIGR01451 family)